MKLVVMIKREEEKVIARRKYVRKFCPNKRDKRLVHQPCARCV